MRISHLLAMAVAGALAACTTSQGDMKDQTPAAAVTPGDRSCQSLRSEIMRMESRGVAKLVDRQHDGGKLSNAQKAEIDTYNGLLNEYLGARCHLN